MYLNFFLLIVAEKSQPKFKLTYFPSKALAEPIRFIFSYAGVEFEDDRFERDNWPKIKPSKFIFVNETE